jgi:hypothetical protein
MGYFRIFEHSHVFSITFELDFLSPWPTPGLPALLAPYLSVSYVLFHTPRTLPAEAPDRYGWNTTPALAVKLVNSMTNPYG